ncbi:spore coat protein SP75 [Tieghemostelium lacteum]|uniref:Spore coat protein SP75 n=1 Tax=Tieghemostelium lacteum TaxID=361077 RepID=A0A152A7U2_TIELA|nr:spore coat protein SP75 [Tieghemostelium lacteum]|eukprot:KYR02302.1 spore coat protein SP75 [Tieghemostelium lacteum]
MKPINYLLVFCLVLLFLNTIECKKKKIPNCRVLSEEHCLANPKYCSVIYGYPCCDSEVFMCLQIPSEKCHTGMNESLHISPPPKAVAKAVAINETDVETEGIMEDDEEMDRNDEMEVEEDEMSIKTVDFDDDEKPEVEWCVKNKDNNNWRFTSNCLPNVANGDKKSEHYQFFKPNQYKCKFSKCPRGFECVDKDESNDMCDSTSTCCNYQSKCVIKKKVIKDMVKRIEAPKHQNKKIHITEDEGINLSNKRNMKSKPQTHQTAPIKSTKAPVVMGTKPPVANKLLTLAVTSTTTSPKPLLDILEETEVPKVTETPKPTEPVVEKVEEVPAEDETQDETEEEEIMKESEEDQWIDEEPTKKPDTHMFDATTGNPGGFRSTTGRNFGTSGGRNILSIDDDLDEDIIDISENEQQQEDSSSTTGGQAPTDVEDQSYDSEKCRKKSCKSVRCPKGSSCACRSNGTPFCKLNDWRPFTTGPRYTIEPSTFSGPIYTIEPSTFSAASQSVASRSTTGPRYTIEPPGFTGASMAVNGTKPSNATTTVPPVAPSNTTMNETITAPPNATVSKIAEKKGPKPSCMTMKCAGGYTCVDNPVYGGRCIKNKVSCKEVLCAQNKYCVEDIDGAKCLDKTTCQNSNCPEGFECLNDVIRGARCERTKLPTCETVKCKSGFICVQDDIRGARCEKEAVPTCASTTCMTGYTCVEDPINGAKCQVKDLCSTVKCPEDSYCVKDSVYGAYCKRKWISCDNVRCGFGLICVETKNGPKCK